LKISIWHFDRDVKKTTEASEFSGMANDVSRRSPNEAFNADPSIVDADKPVITRFLQQKGAPDRIQAVWQRAPIGLPPPGNVE
jgi:hypothetical protein